MNYVNNLNFKDIVRLSLQEDVGERDATSESLIPRSKKIKAALVAKESFIACGLNIAALVAKTQDKNIQITLKTKDGQTVKKGGVLILLEGSARSVLAAERTALNFLSILSGIATKTRSYVEAVKPFKVKILDTRKTIPGLRLLQKYAVRTGGGYNHRLSLDEMVLVKDNHIEVLGSMFWVLGAKEIREKISGLKLEIEVKTLKEFNCALKLRPDIIMLDNMGIQDMKKAVKIRNHLAPNAYNLKPKLEASGGVILKNIKKIASTGVEMISVGALTHSVDSVDISLEIIQ